MGYGICVVYLKWYHVLFICSKYKVYGCMLQRQVMQHDGTGSYAVLVLVGTVTLVTEYVPYQYGSPVLRR